MTDKDKKTTVTVRINGQNVEVPMETDEKGDLYSPGGLRFLGDADPDAQAAMNEALDMRNMAESHKAPVLPKPDSRKVADVFMPVNVVEKKDKPTDLP